MAASNQLDDLRGVGQLAVDATTAVTDLVQAVHVAIGGGAARLLSAPVFASIRGVTALVGSTLDAALAQLGPLLGEATPRPERDVVLAILNGVLGDYLAQTKNPLAIEMRLHRTDDIPPSGKIVIFVHGSSMGRQVWRVARHLGCSPVHLDYNSGLHVSTNGRAFAAMLETLVADWPVPVETLAIVAHSMGGLVTRSACHYADAVRYRWRDKLRVVVFLGTPHHGAPLERAGNWLETVAGATRYSAPFARLGRLRSAGVTDLRFGNVIDEHWNQCDRFERRADTRTPVPLPAGVECYTMAAEHDRLVPLASAMGDHPDPALTLGFPASHRAVASGVGHVQMLRDPAVWEQIERWIRDR